MVAALNSWFLFMSRPLALQMPALPVCLSPSAAASFFDLVPTKIYASSSPPPPHTRCPGNYIYLSQAIPFLDILSHPILRFRSTKCEVARRITAALSIFTLGILFCFI
jgi:hypothetical protein